MRSNVGDALILRLAGEGNKSPTLHFDTVWSGELTVSPSEDGCYCMELPAYTTSSDAPEGAGFDTALVQVNVFHSGCSGLLAYFTSSAGAHSGNVEIT